MIDVPLDVLGGLTPSQFLAEYWQRKPLLVRGALPDAGALVCPDELAGLSLEASVESRLIRQQGETWLMEKGPLAESRFPELPPTHWTLLVQAVDQHVPECAEFLSRFDFLPHWRIDDLMISYAADEGSVGPHFDYYDVFLIQGRGRREWRIGQHCDEDTPLLPGQPLKLLMNFDESARWILEPGDLLYLPPGIAHWGIARGECTTLSVGFRALSEPELVDAFSDFVRHRIPDHTRLSDPGRILQERPALLDNVDIGKIRDVLAGLLQDDSFFRPFLGELLSAPKYESTVPEAQTLYGSMDVLDLMDEGLMLRRNEASRFVYTLRDGRPDGFFVNGREWVVGDDARELAVHLMDHRLPDPAVVRDLSRGDTALQLLTDWLNEGLLYFESDGSEDP